MSASAARGIRPSRAWYWVGGGVVGLGAIAAILLAVLGTLHIRDVVNSFYRNKFPNPPRQLQIDPGNYVIYYETQSKVGGEAIRSPNPPPSPLTVSLVSTGGQEVKLSGYRSTLKYDFGNYHGIAAATFHITTAGVYAMDTSGTPTSQTFVLAIGHSIAQDIALTVAGALIIGFVGLAIGTLIIVLTAVKRRRSGRAFRQAAAMAGGYVTPGPWPVEAPAPSWSPPGQPQGQWPGPVSPAPAPPAPASPNAPRPAAAAPNPARPAPASPDAAPPDATRSVSPDAAPPDATRWVSPGAGSSDLRPPPAATDWSVAAPPPPREWPSPPPQGPAQTNLPPPSSPSDASFGPPQAQPLPPPPSPPSPPEPSTEQDGQGGDDELSAPRPPNPPQVAN